MRRVNLLVFLILTFIILLILKAAISSSQVSGYVVKKDFEVDSLFLKVSLKQDKITERTITIKSKDGGEFHVNIEGIQGISLSENNFFLGSNGGKNIIVKFDSGGIKPGAYIGSLEIKSPKDFVKLPIVFEIESRDVFFDADVNIPIAYSIVAPETSIVAQIKIFNVARIESVLVDIEYYIRNIDDGGILISESESVAINRDNSLITKTLPIPKEVKEGSYIVIVIIRYKSSVGVSSQFVNIADVKLSETPNFEFDSKFAIISVIILIVFLSIFFFFFYLIRDRDKLFLALRKYNTEELKRHRELLLDQQRLFKRRKNYKSTKEIKKEVKQKIRELKAKQKNRVRIFKKLKNVGNIREMNDLLKKWKEKGYNTLLLESKLKGLNANEMRGLLRGWKAKGYE